MRYTKDNINGVTFRVGERGTAICIIDPNYKDTRSLPRVSGHSVESILRELNSNNWIEVIQVDGEWVKGQKFSEPEIY